MKKFTGLFLSIVIIISLFTFAGAQIATLEFDDGNELENFVAPPATTGTWEIADGDLMQTVPRSANEYAIEDFRQILTYKNELGNSFILEFEFTHVDADWFAIAFGIPNIEETYQDNGGQGYIYIFSNPDAKFPRLDFYKCTEENTPLWAYGNENYETAKIKNGKIVGGSEHTNKVRIEKEGDTMRVYVENEAADLINAFGLDGEPTLEFTEPELDIGGYLQLATGRGRVKLHNFKLSEFGSPEPTVTNEPEPTVSESESESVSEDSTPQEDSPKSDSLMKTILIVVSVVVLLAVATALLMKSKNK